MLIINESYVGTKLELKVIISEIEEISLPLEESKMLTFHFSTLSFYQSNKNKYAYKLDPLQKEWVDLGTKNELTLTNLSAGSYFVKVQSDERQNVFKIITN